MATKTVTRGRSGKVSGQRETGRGVQPRARRGSSTKPSLPMLRTSERGTLKRCEFLWDLSYNRKLKPHTDMPALRFGTLIHRAMAGYYIPGIKRGVHPAIGFEKAYQADQKEYREIFGMKVDDDEKWVNAHELGIAMMENYVDEYGKDSDWEVLVTEHPFQVVVEHPLLHTPWFIYTGILDGVWRYRPTKELWIPDHKSTKGIGGTKKYPKIPAWLQMDDQAGAYWSYGVDALIEQGLMKKNQKLAGMLYNYMRKAMPDERASKIVGKERLYLNLNGSVSMKQPSPYFARINIQRDEYDKEMARKRAILDYQRIEMLRSGQLSGNKSPGMFTCPGCPAKDTCELHETGNDWESFITGTTKAWDPYAEHEIYAGR